MGLILASATIPGMSKGGQGVKNLFKGINLLNSPEPLKQLCATPIQKWPPIKTGCVTKYLLPKVPSTILKYRTVWCNCDPAYHHIITPLTPDSQRKLYRGYSCPETLIKMVPMSKKKLYR